MKAQKKPVLVYFSEKAVNLQQLDTTEYDRLREFRKFMESDTLYCRFSTVSEFRTKFAIHLSQVVNAYFGNVSSARAAAFPERSFPELEEQMWLFLGLAFELDLHDRKEDIDEEFNFATARHLMGRLATWAGRVAKNDAVGKESSDADLSVRLTHEAVRLSKLPFEERHTFWPRWRQWHTEARDLSLRWGLRLMEQYVKA